MNKALSLEHQFMAFIALHSSAFQMISMEENAFKNESWITDSVQESGRDLE